MQFEDHKIIIRQKVDFVRDVWVQESLWKVCSISGYQNIQYETTEENYDPKCLLPIAVDFSHHVREAITAFTYFLDHDHDMYKKFAQGSFKAGSDYTFFVHHSGQVYSNTVSQEDLKPNVGFFFSEEHFLRFEKEMRLIRAVHDS